MALFSALIYSHPTNIHFQIPAVFAECIIRECALNNFLSVINTRKKTENITIKRVVIENIEESVYFV